MKTPSHGEPFLIAASQEDAERTLNEAGVPSILKILKRVLHGNFLAFAKGYQFSSKMCQRLRDCHPIIITCVCVCVCS